MNKVTNFFIRIDLLNGPFKYLDNILNFLLIRIDALLLKRRLFLSSYKTVLLPLTKQDLTMSPFILNLYLKPLYSNLGGLTTCADPFTNEPGFVVFLKNPLYR